MQRLRALCRLRAHAAVCLSRVAGYRCTGSILFGGFNWYDSVGSVLAPSAKGVHTPLRVLGVLRNMAVSAVSLFDVRVVRCCVD